MPQYLREIFENMKGLLKPLKDSLISEEFYRNLYLSYPGYGIRFVFSLGYISSIIVTIFLLYKTQSIQDYFETKIVTNQETSIIDNILSNWQIFYYNGTNIVSEEEEPVMIQGSKKQILVAIDPQDQLIGSVRRNIPIIFGKTKLLVGISDSVMGARHVPIEYSEIFGKTNTSLLIDSDLISKIGREYSESFKKILVYIFFPVHVFVNLFTLLLEKTLIIFIAYFTINTFLEPKPTVKSATRLVMYSCGAYAFLLPLSIISNVFVVLAKISQIWTVCLMIYSLSQIKVKDVKE
ncbi:MAG: hypothetical protein SFT91_00355 [Rickettsiaceae bacterium]|nr:hypothetical protein [Rickettsiaceae bacterium]